MCNVVSIVTLVEGEDGRRLVDHLADLASEALELDLLAAARRKVLGAHQMEHLQERLTDAAVMRIREEGGRARLAVEQDGLRVR